jgi:hypothetical protein
VRALILASLLLAGLLAGCGGDDKLDASLTSLKVGDCVDAGAVGNVTQIETVDCSGQGVMKVVKLFEMPEATAFPGVEAVTGAASASDGCPATSTQYLGPTKDSWEKGNDRQIICFAAVDALPSSTLN